LKFTLNLWKIILFLFFIWDDHTQFFFGKWHDTQLLFNRSYVVFFSTHNIHLFHISTIFIYITVLVPWGIDGVTKTTKFKDCKENCKEFCQTAKRVKTINRTHLPCHFHSTVLIELPLNDCPSLTPLLRYHCTDLKTMKIIGELELSTSQQLF
jgi:hypothetical protein